MDLEVHQVFLHFFMRTSKILTMRDVLFCVDFLSQNVLTMFLFSMKHSHLYTAKITPDVNSSL